MGPSEDSEYMEEEDAVKLMLVVLSQDAIQGFYQQVMYVTCPLIASMAMPKCYPTR